MAVDAMHGRYYEGGTGWKTLKEQLLLDSISQIDRYNPSWPILV